VVPQTRRCFNGCIYNSVVVVNRMLLSTLVLACTVGLVCATTGERAHEATDHVYWRYGFRTRVFPHLDTQTLNCFNCM
jgi:hypothetical protein